MKKYLLMFCLLLVSLSGYLQADEEYASISFGGGFGHFYDQGLSALRYAGPDMRARGGYLRETEHFKIHLTGAYHLGGYGALVNNSLYAMQLHAPEFSCLFVFNTNAFNEESPWRLDAGARIFNRTNMVYNADLFNNAFSINNMSTLAASAKLTRESYHAQKHKKFLFIKYTIPQWDGRWNMGFNAGLINLNCRPRYAYMNHFPSLNVDFYENYKFFLGGLRLSTDLGYTWYLKNGNGISLAYEWEAFTTGSRDDHLMNGGSHLAVFTLLFKTN